MPSISVFKMADTNAGATETVIVEIKYISSNNVAIHTENCKPEILLDCTLKEFVKTIRQKSLKTGVAPAPFSFVYLFLNFCFCFVCFVACCVLFLFVCFCFVFAFIFFGFPFLLFPLKSFSYTGKQVYFLLFFLLRFFPVFVFFVFFLLTLLCSVFVWFLVLLLVCFKDFLRPLLFMKTTKN